MQFGKGISGAGGNKQNPIVAVAAIVIILVAGFMVYRNMAGSSAPSGVPEGVPMPGMPGGMQGGPSMPPPPGGPQQSAPPPSSPAPTMPAQPSPSAQTAVPAAPAAQPAPSVPSAPSPKQATQPGKEIAMKTIKVFGSITVIYPEGWKISAARGNTAAVFTNGTASFEVLPPDMKANSAQAIAQAAVKFVASGGSVTGQGADKLNGSDVYWIGLTRGGEKMRVVGVDAATRVVLVMRAPSGKFAAYTDTFNKMQSGMSFGR